MGGSALKIVPDHQTPLNKKWLLIIKEKENNIYY